MILQEEPLKNNHQNIQKIESLSDWIESQSNDILKDIPIDDERLDLPSASKIESYFLCPGKYLAEKGIPEESSNEDADRGTRIHNYLDNPSNENYSKLDREDVSIAFRCKRQALQVIKEWNIEDKAYELLSEKRFWLEKEDGEKLVSGKADVLAIQDHRCLIIDYKTGRNESEESVSNEQLRTLAILSYLNILSIKEVRVAIIQPLVSNEPQVCDYYEEDINLSKIRLMSLLHEIKNPNALRKAGKRQCDYCKAKMTCPEANQMLIIPEFSKEVSPLQMSNLLDRAAMSSIMIKIIRKEAKKMNLSGIKIPNYESKPGNDIRIIKDAQKAYECLKNHLTADEFRECCKVEVGSIEDILSEKLNLHGRNLRNKVADLLGDHMEIKKNSPSLKRLI